MMQLSKQFDNLNKLRGTTQQAVTTINQPKYYWLTRPLAAFFVTRLIVFLGAYLAEIALPSRTGDGLYHVDPNNIFLDVWARWDSSFYINIVRDGYFFAEGFQSSVAFFPLYPMFIYLLEPLAGSLLAAGVLVSNLSLVGALIFLYKLTDFEFNDSGTATRTVFYIAAFPTAFFFTAVYTESTFLLFAVGSMYFARKGEWGWAALFGMLTSATRIVGVLMLGVVGLEWLRKHGWTLDTMHKKEAWLNMLNAVRRDYISLGMILMIPLGVFSYMHFLNTHFGDPVAFSTTQSAWGRQTVGPIAVVMRDVEALFAGNFMTGEIWYHLALDLGAFAAVMLVSFFIWQRLGASYALYAMLCVLIPASSGSQSISRYVLVVFPFFMMLGVWGKNALLDRTLLIGFSVFLGILTSVFVNWIFIA